MIVVDQGAARLTAPDALAEELNRSWAFFVPGAANRVDLLPPVEKADQAGGVIVQMDLIIPLPQAEEHVHLHDLDADSISVIREMHLRGLLRGRRNGFKR